MSHPYERLTPDLILDAVADVGLQPDGHLLALNSYENRVLQIGIADTKPMVAKFYRPQRWSDEAILEEHAFATELAAAEIPVVAAWVVDDGSTLYQHAGFRFALFPRRGGRAPEPGDLDQLEWIGRFIGRIRAQQGPVVKIGKAAVAGVLDEQDSHAGPELAIEVIQFVIQQLRVVQTSGLIQAVGRFDVIQVRRTPVWRPRYLSAMARVGQQEKIAFIQFAGCPFYRPDDLFPGRIAGQ